MPRRPALLTQADIARTLRAAKQAGATSVDVPIPGGGTMRVHLSPTLTGPGTAEPEQEVVL